MRTGGTIDTGASSSPSSLASAPVHSPWHSPIPYLFGGLAAMLGLIAFALLILACSYWKFSGFLESGDQGGENERDLENGGEDEKSTGESIKLPSVYEQKIVVIMAGDEKPTFLATPIFSKASSFEDFNSKNQKEKEDQKSDETEKPKEDEEENGHEKEQTENRVTQDTQHHHQNQ